MRKKIIVDVSGADAAPEVIVSGALAALSGQDEYDIVLAGPANCMPSAEMDRVETIIAEDAVSNFDNPTEMIKGKNETSMVKALQSLKEREDIVGMVSAGSTGCLLVGSCFRLGLFGKLLQPALSSALFNVKGGYVCLVDCGANVNPRIKDLVDFARMGSAYMSAIKGVDNPTVGLINVGTEKGKGNELMKEAYTALENDETINFIGNIEGSGVLMGEADVVVCDGFTGNVLLKSLEATGLIAARMAGSPEKIVNFFDYNSQGGGTFLGTRKIVVKAHGAATSDTITSCIRQVWSLEKGGFIPQMQSRIEGR